MHDRFCFNPKSIRDGKDDVGDRSKPCASSKYIIRNAIHVFTKSFAQYFGWPYKTCVPHKTAVHVLGITIRMAYLLKTGRHAYYLLLYI